LVDEAVRRQQGPGLSGQAHIELIEPPVEAATAAQFRDLSRAIQVPTGESIIWAISPEHILDEVREAGIRVI
jgi:hypothetical protein